MKLGAGFDQGVDVGPLCYPELKSRVLGILDTVEKEGAKFNLDGRKYVNPSYPKGNFVGPTIIDHLEEHHTAYKEEIFGPVLCIVR